jgi:predicted dehydrogenase
MCRKDKLQEGKLPTDAGYGIEPESEKGLLHTETNGKIVREYIPSLTGNYTAFYEGIYNAIRTNTPLPVTAEEGMNVIKIIEAAFKSNKEKKVIDL